MKLYEERNNKREIQCGYCFNEGHNKRNCPTMKAHWESNKHLDPKTAVHDDLVGVDDNMFPKHYRTYWGAQVAHRQYFSHLAYMTKRFAPKSETKAKKRKKPSCGFCGSKAHNRRNCNKLKNFIYVMNEANKAYRSQFYDRFIDGMGIGAGALLTVRGDHVGIVTSFPTEEIMFTNMKPSWSDYHSHAPMGVLVDGTTIKHNIGSRLFHCDDEWDEKTRAENGIWINMYSSWGSVRSVISPAPKKPTKEWFMGQSPCFDFIVKRRDQIALMTELSGLIKTFYPHNNLRSKLGGKTYDRFYTR